MRALALLAALALTPAAARAQPSTAPAPSSPPASELVTAAARQVLGVPGGRPLSGPELDTRTEDVAALLRCVVCQGLSVADSPSSAAQNMKRQVRDLLAAGYDGQQVLAYYERSYGEFVRLQPPLRGINWLLWLAPALALAGGGFVFVRMTRRRAATQAAAPAGAAEAAADPALARYLERVRALACDGGEAAPPAPGRRETR